VPGAGILKAHQLSLSCIYRRCRFLVIENMGIESESGVRGWSRRRVVSVNDYLGVFGPPEPLKAR
jgi:hypothetical protein